MKELPISERPYEKFKLYGPENLSNAELLAIIIKTGTKEESVLNIAQKILQEDVLNKGLSFIEECSLKELTKIKGIGEIKAIQIKAVMEIAKRIKKPIDYQKVCIRGPQNVFELVGERLRHEKREILKGILLDSKNKVLKIYDISIGGASIIDVKPRDILVEPIKMQAAGIILVHNHPSRRPQS